MCEGRGALNLCQKRVSAGKDRIDRYMYDVNRHRGGAERYITLADSEQIGGVLSLRTPRRVNSE